MPTLFRWISSVMRIFYSSNKAETPLKLVRTIGWKHFDKGLWLNLLWKMLINNFSYYGMMCGELKLLQSYLSGWNQIIVQGQDYLSFQQIKVRVGVPQGLIFAPLLFIITVIGLASNVPYAFIWIFTALIFWVCLLVYLIILYLYYFIQKQVFKPREQVLCTFLCLQFRLVVLKILFFIDIWSC